MAMQGRDKKKKREKKRTEQAGRELLFEFMDAAFDDHAKAKAMLVDHPELMNARRMGEAVPHFVAVEGHIEVVKFLAGLGFDVNTVSEGGTTPLIDVALLGNDEMAALLLSLGANPNATCDT